MPASASAPGPAAPKAAAPSGEFLWQEMAGARDPARFQAKYPLLEVDTTCALLQNTEQDTPPESAAHFESAFAACMQSMAAAGFFAQHRKHTTRLYLHPPVYTCEQASKFCASERMEKFPHHEMKNLFLKDKKKNMFLISALVDTEVRLNNLKLKGAASGGLSFASNDLLLEVLGLLPGSVTPFGLLQDCVGAGAGNGETKQPRVTYYLDKRALEGDCAFLGFHPNACNATVAVHRDLFVDFITSVTGHEVNLLE